MSSFFSNLIQVFWSLFPRNFYVLVSLSAICEAASTWAFKVSGNRGWLSGIAYLLGFLVVAFYGEALKYSKLGQSYPIWLALVAVLIAATSILILRENIRFGIWILGFMLVVGGLVIIQFSLPSD